MLRKIECYLRPSKMDELRDFLIEKGVPGMTVHTVRGFGRRSEDAADEEVDLEERTKVEIVLEESLVEPVISELKDLAGQDEIGAGKIFVLSVEDAIRISTDEKGRDAIY